ncbi:MAG: gliding motility-associated C-terminal domain-containing protein [Bacteroidota bacterium]
MKKFCLQSLGLLIMAVAMHCNAFAQSVPCPTVTATGVPTVSGTPGVVLPCGVPSATLTATPPVTLAATTTYSVTSIVYAPFSFTGGTDATSGAGLLTTWDDRYGNVIPLPFTFCYFGNPFTSVVMGTNGNMSFNAAVANSYDPWPISGPLPASGVAQPTAVQNCILAPWQDLLPTSGGATLKYAVYGTAPCRQFVASWNNCKLFVSAPPGSEATYQVVLHETSNIIDINIQKRVPYTGWNNGYAVTGICNATTTLFYTPPGQNGTTFSATNEGWRFTPTGAASGWTYTWTGPTGVVGTGITAVVSPTITTTYTVTATSAACAGATVTTPITVTVAGYVYPITGTLSMCKGVSNTLSSMSIGGTWSSSNPSIATINGATGVLTGVNAGTATITYDLGAGCFTTAVATINPIPAPPAITPQVYCQYELPSSALSAAGSGITWYGPGVTVGYTTAPYAVTTVPGVTTYYATQTSAFGCTSDSASGTVTVKPKPAPPVPTPAELSYCQFFNGAIALTASGSNLTWYNATGTALGSAPIPATTFVGTTTWFVEQKVDGCPSDKAPVNVTIIFKPDFDIKFSRTTICQFDTMRLSYNGPAMVGPGYFWDIPFGMTIVEGLRTDSSIVVRFDTAWGAHTIYLTASNLNGQCFTTERIDIKVVPEPAAHAYIKRDICIGDTVTLALTNHTDNSLTYAWLVDDTLLANSAAVNVITASSNSGGPKKITFNILGQHIIKVQTFAEGGCPSKLAPDSLYVHALPDATFKIKSIRNKVCLEDSVLFSANATGDNYAYLWTPEHYFHNVNDPEIWGRVENVRSIVTLTVTDPFGCEARSALEINPETCCTVTFPSAFSPNGDSRNDVFKPLFAGYHRFQMFRITNRWGQTVFETTNSNPSWDGSYNGVPQDMGVYFFYIKYDCGGKTLEDKGDVTLVR